MVSHSAADTVDRVLLMDSRVNGAKARSRSIIAVILEFDMPIFTVVHRLTKTTTRQVERSLGKRVEWMEAAFRHFRVRAENNL
jgi:hypothetical protein